MASSLDSISSRRGFLKALAVAPAVILTPGLLMPVRKIWTPHDGQIITTIDPAGYDYSAWVTMQWDGLDPNSLHIVDWGPKDGRLNVKGSYISYEYAES